MCIPHPAESRWRQAVEAGHIGVWDLRPPLETVQHSPAWKQRLGFPNPEGVDSTYFWRCRVHPADLLLMLDAQQAVAGRDDALYEARFRLRSNGSGYRLLFSRGRIVERDAAGRVLRMVGTMLDLTDRPATPGGGLAGGARGALEGAPLALPFHALLGASAPAAIGAARWVQERERVLPLVQDLLTEAVEQLAAG